MHDSVNGHFPEYAPTRSRYQHQSLRRGQFIICLAALDLNYTECLLEPTAKSRIKPSLGLAFLESIQYQKVSLGLTFVGGAPMRRIASHNASLHIRRLGIPSLRRVLAANSSPPPVQPPPARLPFAMPRRQHSSREKHRWHGRARVQKQTGFVLEQCCLHLWRQPNTWPCLDYPEKPERMLCSPE